MNEQRKTPEGTEVERRYMTAPVQMRMEKRMDGEEEKEYAVVEGIAAKVGVRTSLGWFDEIIEPGAFDEALASEDLDCRCLINHDPNLVLARKRTREPKRDTLELFINDEGHLAYRFTTPNRSYARDLVDMLERGDVDQSSFQFTIKEQSWVWAEDRNENDLRKVIKVRNLYDVSPVTFPAYQDTSVAKRSHEEAKKEIKETRNGKPLKRSLIDPIINANLIS